MSWRLTPDCDVTCPNSGRGTWGAGRSRESVACAIGGALVGRKFDDLRVVGACGRDYGLGGMLTEFVPESDAAFALAGHDNGIIALAGTGAAVTVRTPAGEDFRYDGLGPHIGDHGSGYATGHAALRAAAQATWHPRHRTSLAARVYRACLGDNEASGNGGLIMFAAESKDRAEFASLARVVDEEARAGDAIAVCILQKQAEDMAGTIYDAVQSHDLQREECALIGTGGVIANSDIYWKHLCSFIEDFAPNLKPVRLQLPSVLGVAVAAMRKTSPDISPVRERLLSEAKAYLEDHNPRTVK
jgi:N-acetylglucosamine kinase-like BadF-type ATPase